MKTKRIISIILPILFVTSLIPLFMTASTTTVSASPGWWDTSWAYRRTITISPLNPENFQIKVVIPSVIPTSQYASIRFLENETTGVLPYWIESHEGTYDNNYMNIAWVRRLENSDNTIYMYYGNGSATSAENGDNVFLFFDGFVGSSVDSNKWATAEGNVSVSSNVLHLWANGKIEHGESKGLTTEEENTRRVVETRVKNATNNRGGLFVSGSGWDHEETACIFTKSGTEYRFWSKNYPGTSDGGYLSQQNHPQDVYYILRVDLYGASKDKSKTHFYWGNDNSMYRNLVEESQELTNTWDPPGDHVDKYSLRAWDGSSSYYFDWIFVRKYADTDPVATVGSAENYDVDVSITPSLQHGWTGDSLVYTVTVTNTGTFADNYSITLSDNLNWATLVPTGDNLILTEYIEMSFGNNKAYEIYNPTNNPIDLSGYRLEEYNNGGGGALATRNLSGILNPGDVWVIVNPLENTGMSNVADVIDSAYPNVTSCNGDDSVRLAFIADNSTVDAIGQYLVDPGTIWIGGSTENTYVRSGNANRDTNFLDAFNWGTDGWVSVGKDNSSYLGWHRVLGPIIRQLNPGENWTGTIVARVSSPGCTTDNITVTATSVNNSAVSDSDTCQAHSALAGVSVSISPSSENGANNTTLNYTVTVTNTGDAADNILLTVGDNAGWSPSVLPTSVVVPASGSDNSVTLSVTIPGNAIGGTIDNITVTGTSKGDNTVSSFFDVFAEVNTDRSVTVSIEPSLNVGENGDTLTYTVTVTNTGNVSDTYTLDNTDTSGWVKSLSNNSVGPLAPFGGSDNTTILGVTIPSGANDGDEDNITVTATSQTDNAVNDSDVCTARCSINIVRGVSVSITPASLSGANGATLNYTVTVTNTGNIADTYDLSANDDAGWSPGVLPTSLYISSGNSDNATLSVTIPSLAIGGTIDNITVTATSQADNSVSDSDGCTAEVTVSRSVSVSIAPASQSGANGATLNYTVTVNNTGNVADTYALDNTDTLGWDKSLSNVSVGVAAFSSDNTTTLSVTLPLVELGGTIDSIAVTANGTGDSDNDTCTAQIAVNKTVSVSTSPSDKTGWSGDNLVFDVTVTNTGNVPDNYKLSLTDTLPWLAGWDAPSEVSDLIYASTPDNTIKSTDDGGVVEGNPNTNNGHYYNMYVGIGATYLTEWAYLKFPLSSIPVGAVIDNAYLYAGCGFGPSHAPGNTADNMWVEAYNVDNDSWNEWGIGDNLTWNNRPVPDGTTLLDNVHVIASVWIGYNHMYTWDVSSYVTSQFAGDGVVSLRLASNGKGDSGADNNAGWFYTKDNESHNPGGIMSPYLKVYYHLGGIAENSLSLDVDENWTGTFWVVVGAGAMGSIDNKTVTATSMTDNAVTASATSYAHKAVGGVDVSIAPAYQSGSTGNILDYTVTVINTGELTDNISLSKYDTQGWTTSLDDTLFSDVPALENRSTTLHVTLGGTGIDEVTVLAGEQGAGQIDSDNCVAESTSVAFSLNLVAGWNLVCFPVTAVTNTPENIFAGLTWGVDYTIYSWTAPGGPYNLIGPTDVLQDNLAYWVSVTSDQTITWNGTQPTSRDVYLVTGWNMAGFPIENASTNPDNIFTGMTWGVDYNIYWWTAPGGPYNLLGPTDLFLDNTGYWVYVNADKVVTVP